MPRNWGNKRVEPGWKDYLILAIIILYMLVAMWASGGAGP